MKVCVIGLGYIGLPTAAILASKGHEVIGVDVDPVVLENIRKQGAPPEEPGLADVVKGALASGKLIMAEAPRPADAFIICLPTPILANKKADLSYVESGMDSILPVLAKGNMVILESTVPPGTTAGLVADKVKSVNLDPVSDLDLAFAPERVIPGNILHEIQNLDRTIGGLTRKAAERARDLYSCFVKGEIILTDATTAEFVKLVENSYRDVNIAFANELAILSYDFGIDVREAIDIANRHPRVNILQPGPGVGGHCIAVDPYFIIEGSPGNSRMLATARAVNHGMPELVVKVIGGMLGSLGGKKIALLGLAYKANVGDMRESPALEVKALLEKAGASCTAHDPFVTRPPFPLQGLEEALTGADAIIVVTGHDSFRELDPVKLLELAKGDAVLDTRRILDRARWESAGWKFRYLGDGRLNGQ